MPSNLLEERKNRKKKYYIKQETEIIKGTMFMKDTKMCGGFYIANNLDRRLKA